MSEILPYSIKYEILNPHLGQMYWWGDTSGGKGRLIEVGLLGHGIVVAWLLVVLDIVIPKVSFQVSLKLRHFRDR